MDTKIIAYVAGPHLTNTVQTAPEFRWYSMGDWIDGDVGDDGQQVAIGKNLRQTNIQRDTASWREFVRRDLNSIDDRVVALNHRIQTLVVAVAILFFLGAVMAGMMVRQFDLRGAEIGALKNRVNNLESIERIRAWWPEYAPGVPSAP